MTSDFQISRRDLNAIARERWGLRHEMVVRRRNLVGRVQYLDFVPWGVLLDWGWHVGQTWINADGSLDHTRRRHFVRLANGPLETMLRTVAHELEHSAQQERMGWDTFDILYVADRDGFESAAMLAEDRWRELIPAVRLRRGVSLRDLLEEGSP